MPHRTLVRAKRRRVNRGDLTKPDADGDEEQLSGSPSDESRRIEELEPAIPEVIPEPPSELEAAGAEGQTRVVLLPVDPYLVHAYWRLAPQDLEKAYTLLAEYGQQAQAALKFYDVTHIIFDGANAHASFEVNIELGVGNWYVHLWSPGRSYCVDLGFRTEGGGFLPLARSNVAETPRAQPSARVEERYTLVEGELPGAETSPPPMECRDGPLISARIGAKSPSKPTLLPPDLTEASEKKLVSGLSSWRGVENQEENKASTQTS